MSNHNRDIGSQDYKVMELVKELKEDKFLVPTFQREFVWQPANILRLWDSIYKFYPIGSILYWETNSYLHTHRRLGGFVFPHDEDAVRKFKEWKYILDGQQRATSLLVSLLGGKGKVEDQEEFDYTLYFDASNGSFFFAGELGKRKASTVNEQFLIRVKDVPDWAFSFYKEISAENGFNSVIESNLGQISRIFTDYKIPVVHVKGVEVNEVCDIFERINQEGKRLDPVDIIVARTYRNEDLATGNKGFYLRDYLDGFREVLIQKGNRYQELDDLAVIQMVSLCRRKEYAEKRNPYGITPNSLQNLSASDFEGHWEKCKQSIMKTIKLFTDMRIHGPAMLPYIYFMLPLCYYLHGNKTPNKEFMRQWFWRTAFDQEEFRTSTQVVDYCEKVFDPLEQKGQISLPPLTISKSRLIRTSYNYRNALSRAVLAFLAYQTPLDFSDPHAVVLDNVYLLLSQAPNLHHIFPQNFLKKNIGSNPEMSIDSLMNICFLRAETNIKISDTTPLEYLKDFNGSIKGFDIILKSHLIPEEYIHRDHFSPEEYKEFLYTRANIIATTLKKELTLVEVMITE